MTCQREPLPPDEEAGPEIDPHDPRRADKWVYTEADMDCIMPGLQAPRPDAEPTIDPHDPRRADKWGYTASEIFTVIPDLKAKLAQQGKLAPTVPLPRLPSSSVSSHHPRARPAARARAGLTPVRLLAVMAPIGPCGRTADSRPLVRSESHTPNLATIVWVLRTFGDSGYLKQNCHSRGEGGTRENPG